MVRTLCIKGVILHCGNEFLKQVLNFFFKVGDMFPKYGSIFKSYFLVIVGITCFGTQERSKKYELLYDSL